jgi:SAM-dependent methyltransferase
MHSVFKDPGAALLLMALCGSQALAQTPHTHEHSFQHAEQWAGYFDDPKRDEWQKPHEVIGALKLVPDATVADIGAGTGYFSVRFAHMLPKGRVYAVDLEPDMVKYLTERAKKENLANMTPVAAAPDDPRLPAPVDLAIFVDVYHHVADRLRYLQKLRDSIKPGGRVAIIDFQRDAATGPPKSSRIPPDQVKADFKRAGYVLANEHTFLPDQYFLVFRVARKGEESSKQ